MNRVLFALLSLILSATTLVAYPSYRGYSGAPGTNGTCAGACHGSSGGTIVVVGFPSSYTPGQTYVVSVVQRGGSSVNNFNASVRVGSGSQTAGTISAGYMTETYSTGSEPNGVHLSSVNQDSCSFTWLAPDPGVGDVKLYLAGHQTASAGGPNTVHVLTASQGAGVVEAGTGPVAGLTLAVHPTVVTNLVTFRVHAPARTGRLSVIDRTGRVVSRLSISGADWTILWQPTGNDGRRLAPGTYFAVVNSGGEQSIGRLILH